MLKYLINYDIETEIKNEDIITEYEIDINDRMILQEQVNNIRKTYFRLIKLFDELQANLVSFESEKDKKIIWLNFQTEMKELKTSLMILNFLISIQRLQLLKKLWKLLVIRLISLKAI